MPPINQQPQNSANMSAAGNSGFTRRTPEQKGDSNKKQKPRPMFTAPDPAERSAMQSWYESPGTMKLGAGSDQVGDVPLFLDPPCICYWKQCMYKCSDTVQPHACWLCPCHPGFKPCACLCCKSKMPVSGKWESRCYEIACPCNGNKAGVEEAIMWMPWYRADACCMAPEYKAYPGDCCYFEDCGINAKDRWEYVKDDIRVRHLYSEIPWKRWLMSCSTWACCTPFCACVFCCACKQRKEALHGDLTRYRCCQDRYCQGERYACSCIDRGLEKCESNPQLGLCCEVVCCTYCAVYSTREHVWDEKGMVTDPCDIRLLRWENCTVNIAYPISYALELFINVSKCMQGQQDCCCISGSCFLDILRPILDICGLGCLLDLVGCCFDSALCGTLTDLAECLDCLVDCWICVWMVAHCRCGCVMAQLQPELDAPEWAK